MFKLCWLIILLVGTSLSQEGCFEKSYSRISEKKCDEYKDLVADINKSFGLILPHLVRCDTKTYECGSVGTSAMIVGGYPASLGEFPHMAAIGWRLDDGSVAFKCGGSLISERFVLTAAHCSYNVKKREPSFVRLGTRNLDDAGSDSAPLERNIKKFINYYGYDNTSYIHDIALIELDNDVTFHKVHLRPACLQQSEYDGATVTATGWGKVEQFLKVDNSDQLMKVALPVNNFQRCIQKLGSAGLNSTSQICAGGKLGKDTCQGDSGAPIQSSHSEVPCVYNIIGITTFGSYSCGTKAPAVYTKVKYYLTWIENIVWPGQEIL